MATNSTFWQEQSPVSSPGVLQGEEGMRASPCSPVQNKEAPRASPEEDIDVTEPGAEAKVAQDNLTVQEVKTVDVTQMENEKSADLSQSTPRGTPGQIPKKLSEVFSAEEDSEEDLVEENFPPPLLSFSISSEGENCEKKSLSSLEGEESELISEVEVILDPTDDPTSFQSQNSQGQPKTPQVSEPIYQEEDKIPQTNPAVEPNVDSSEVENDTSHPVQQPPSDDANTVNSPDENDEEEGASVDEMSSLQQWNTLDLSCKVSQSSSSAWTGTKQKEELLPQSQHELNPRGAIQEAAQQVFDQGSPPLSAVAMEPPDQGGEASRGGGCAAAIRERLSWVGERTGRENRQTGEEEGQKGSILEVIETAEWSGSSELSGYQQTDQTRETQTGKYSCSSPSTENRNTRMKNNVSDNSQSKNGVSEDFSPYRTPEGTTISPAGSSAQETPIEREIRRAIEREKSLRRSRGLPTPCTSPEYVEIPLRKGFLSQSVTTKWSQNKDREFAGKKMQQEIHEQTRREQDLLRTGKVPDVYDKGTVPQIRESKQLFEAFQAPRDTTLLVAAKTQTLSLSSGCTEDLSMQSQEVITTRVSTSSNSHSERKTILLHSMQNTNPAKGGSNDSTLRGPGLSEGTSCRITILENSTTGPAQKQNRVKAEAKAANAANPSKSSGEARWRDGPMATEQQEDVASKENPFFKLRSSTNLVKVRQDILESKEREMELHKMRVSLYGGTNGAVSSSRTGLTLPGVPESSAKMRSGPSTG